MITAIDTNILLDVLLQDPVHFITSKEQLLISKGQGSLIISPPVYSELVTQFTTRFGEKMTATELGQFLQKTGIDFIPFSKRSLEIAGIAWMTFTKRRDKSKIKCQECGKLNELYCPNCSAQITWRNHIITDFLIGGHAQDLADRLLTRDRGFYGGYFPSLNIL